MYCNNCGAYVDDSLSVCPTCGAPAGAAAQPNYQQPNYQQPNYQQPNYQQPGYQQPGYQQPGYQQPMYQQPGYQQPMYQQQPANDTMATVIKVFLIISCIVLGIYIIPLAWCIPMTISVWKSLNEHRPISTAMKICVLLFVNTISGILLLVDKNT